MATKSKAKSFNLNHSSKFPSVPLLLLLVLLTLITSVTLVFLALENGELKQQVNGLKPSKDYATSSATQNKNWETFSGSLFSFSYPTNLDLSEDGQDVLLTFWGPTQKPNTEFYDGISLRFEPHKLPVNRTLQAEAQAKIDELSKHGVVDISSRLAPLTVAGLNGFTFTTTGLGQTQYIYLQKLNTNDYIIVYNSTIDPGNLGFQNTVTEVLKTFKFN